MQALCALFSMEKMLPTGTANTDRVGLRRMGCSARDVHTKASHSTRHRLGPVPLWLDMSRNSGLGLSHRDRMTKERRTVHRPPIALIRLQLLRCFPIYTARLPFCITFSRRASATQTDVDLHPFAAPTAWPSGCTSPATTQSASLTQLGASCTAI